MSWKKRALAAALAGLCLLSGCSLPGRQQDEGPKDTVDVSDAYFGLAWYKNGPLNPVTDTDSINAMLREALYEGLFELTDDFTPQNVLCEGYSANDKVVLRHIGSRADGSNYADGDMPQHHSLNDCPGMCARELAALTIFGRLGIRLEERQMLMPMRERLLVPIVHREYAHDKLGILDCADRVRLLVKIRNGC